MKAVAESGESTADTKLASDWDTVESDSEGTEPRELPPKDLNQQEADDETFPVIRVESDGGLVTNLSTLPQLDLMLYRLQPVVPAHAWSNYIQTLIGANIYYALSAVLEILYCSRLDRIYLGDDV